MSVPVHRDDSDVLLSEMTRRFRHLALGSTAIASQPEDAEPTPEQLDCAHFFGIEMRCIHCGIDSPEYAAVAPSPAAAGAATTEPDDDKCPACEEVERLNAIVADHDSEREKWRTAYDQRLDEITELRSSLARETAARAAAEQERDCIQRTLDFQSETYLASHGGSWGVCKYQAEVASLRAERDVANAKSERLTKALEWIESHGYEKATDLGFTSPAAIALTAIGTTASEALNPTTDEADVDCRSYVQ